MSKELSAKERNLFSNFDSYLSSTAVIRKEADLSLKKAKEYESKSENKEQQQSLRQSFNEVFPPEEDAPEYNRPAIETVVVATTREVIIACSKITNFTKEDQSFITDLLLKIFKINPKLLGKEGKVDLQKVEKDLSITGAPPPIKNIIIDYAFHDLQDLYGYLKEEILDAMLPQKHLTNPSLLDRFLKLNPKFVDDCFAKNEVGYYEEGELAPLPHGKTLFNYYIDNSLADLLKVMLQNLTKKELLKIEDDEGRTAAALILGLKSAQPILFKDLSEILSDKDIDLEPSTLLMPPVNTEIKKVPSPVPLVSGFEALSGEDLQGIRIN